MCSLCLFIGPELPSSCSLEDALVRRLVARAAREGRVDAEEVGAEDEGNVGIGFLIKAR